MELVTLQDVSKTYAGPDGGVLALRDISLSIWSGEFMAIVGPSGSGKSSLLHILGGMMTPTTGRVVIGNVEVFRLSQDALADFRRNHLGFVFQQHHLIPYLTALENVLLPLAVDRNHSNGRSRADRALAALERVGLRQRAHHLPDQLSGGEQGRVAIARAIVNDPHLILADEPTGSLDSATGGAILEVFAELNRQGHTIVVVTHSPRTAEIAQRVITMQDGAIHSERGNP
ncbi:MAG: ABC transporter ATP-binding protein [Chloroflexota bacterium]|nr:MAG: ABC transporter ATP-binding protein [Chloroflexota bacterium]